MHRIESDNITVTADGKNQYKNGPPGTTVNAEAMNTIQEEICNVITSTGISIKRKSGDPQNQLVNAINTIKFEYDTIITNQTAFNSIIERVAANQYKISDDYRSIYIKYATGGYACSGASSFLSSGDTWGYIETNNCAKIVCEAGATFDFADTVGYIEFDTNDGRYDSISIVGAALGAVALTQSFLLNALRVQFNHCSTTSRLSNTDFVGFQGSGTALHNITSSYNGCSVYTIDGTDKLYGFKDCMNLSNCNAYDIDGTVDSVNGFKDCSQLSTCYAYDLEASGVGDVYGFDTSNQLSACIAKNIDSVDGQAYGFSTCKQISSCTGDGITSVNANAMGFIHCEPISACFPTNIIGGVAAYGFFDCHYGAALFTTEAVNSGNDWMDTVDVQITNKVSTPSIWT